MTAICGDRLTKKGISERSGSGDSRARPWTTVSWAVPGNRLIDDAQGVVQRSYALNRLGDVKDDRIGVDDPVPGCGLAPGRIFPKDPTLDQQSGRAQQPVVVAPIAS